MAGQLQWRCHDFAEFTTIELYEVLQLRDQVFVVEQQSIYGDVDGVDQKCWHLSARDEAGRLVAYARLIPPGLTYADAAAIGRVVIPPRLRGSGIGKPLMSQAIRHCQRLFAGFPLMLSSQADRQPFYASFGFVAVSAPYDDGGIPHVDMRKES